MIFSGVNISGMSASVSVGSSDPNWNNVVLLAHFNDVNGSTTFTDSSQYNKAMSGTAVPTISTAQSKWGGSSLLLNGTTQYVNIVNDATFDLDASDLTVEAWIYQTGTTTEAGVFSIRNGASVKIDLRIDAFNRLIVGGTWVGGAITAGAVGSLTLNTWHHIALTCARSSTTMYAFLDGVLKNSYASAISGNPWAIGDTVHIGTYDAVAGNFFKGYIDDVRVTSVCRYNATFTPPTAQFPNS